MMKKEITAALGAFDRNFDRIERWLLYALVATVPVTMLPKRYPLPWFMHNVSQLVLVLAFVTAAIYFVRNYRHRIEIGLWEKIFLGACIIWPFLCTIIGVVVFPYWDETADEFLRSTNAIQKIARLYPEILTHTELLHIKYIFSQCSVTIKQILLPLLGIPFIFWVSFHGKGNRYILQILSKASLILACAFSLYSVFEIDWLLTGNGTAETILKAINLHLYDPATSYGWWPKLLWTHQLRSFTYEPAFFGIMAVFILPFLWYRAFYLKEKFTLFILVLLTVMLYMTRSRTAQVIFLGELIVLAALSLLGRYPQWKRRMAAVGAVSVLSFVLYLAALVIVSHGEVSIGYLLQRYIQEDVETAFSSDKRSNKARLGNTVAMFTVGAEHPVLGVGTNMASPYMVDKFPPQTQDSSEVQLWISLLKTQGFMKTGFPTLNTYARFMADYGIPGLFLFLIPMVGILIRVVQGRKRVLHDFGMVCVLTACSGQVVCLFVNNLLYTYPLILSTAYCLIHNLNKDKQ